VIRTDLGASDHHGEAGEPAGTQTNLVTHEYDTTGAPETNPTFGWVTKQTHADGGICRFAYTFANGKIANTLVTDPRGKKRRVTFNGTAIASPTGARSTSWRKREKNGSLSERRAHHL
jgi:hypothetical protein